MKIIRIHLENILTGTVDCRLINIGDQLQLGMSDRALVLLYPHGTMTVQTCQEMAQN